MSSRRLALVLACLLTSAVAQAQSSIPTPESVIGFVPGAEHKLATYEQTIAYFKKLDAASDYMTLMEAGMTPQEALDFMVKGDNGARRRQIAILDFQGRSAGWDGQIGRAHV